MADARPLLGFDIGGTKSAAVVADAAGRILGRAQIATDPDPERTLSRLIAEARELLAGQTPLGVGVACGGPLDRERGVILRPPNLPLWDDVPVKARFEEAFGVETRVENDANACALAEHRLGGGKGFSHLAWLTMGTGVGAGLILNGELYRGRDDLAGELGHSVLAPNGKPCGCGKRGCLEALASGPSIARMAGAVSARDVVEAANAGDEVARAVLGEAGYWMGVGVANLLMVLNLEAVFFGTVAIHAGEWVMAPLREAVAENAWPRVADRVLLSPSPLGDTVQSLAPISLWLG